VGSSRVWPDRTSSYCRCPPNWSRCSNVDLSSILECVDLSNRASEMVLRPFTSSSLVLPLLPPIDGAANYATRPGKVASSVDLSNVGSSVAVLHTSRVNRSHRSKRVDLANLSREQVEMARSSQAKAWSPLAKNVGNGV